MNRVWRQFRLEWKLFSRDRMAMLWTFLFPVLMLAGFGVIFRPSSGAALTLVSVRADAAPPDGEGLAEALSQTPVKVVVLTAEEAEVRWRRGETAAQLEWVEEGYRLKVNAYLMAQGQAAAQIVQQAHLIAQAKRQGVETRLIPIQSESPGHARATNYAAFLLPGLIGLNLLTMGLFSVGMINVSYREKGKFRRLAVTPLPKWIFLAGQVLHRLTVVVLQTLVMLGVGYFAFGIANRGTYLALALVLALGTACFMAVGFALAGFAETAESYAALSNLVFFPMMLLSGVYFTLDSAPRWIQQAVVALPLSPYLKALRAVFNDGAGLGEHAFGLALVAAWTLAAFLLAVRRFRWSWRRARWAGARAGAMLDRACRGRLAYGLRGGSMASTTRTRGVGRSVAAVLLLAASSVGIHAQERTGVVRLQVTPDRADWTYAVGAPVAFRVSATRDGHPLALPSVTWKVGPEMLDPVEEKSAPLPAEGLTVKAAGLKQPGFVRLVATASLEGQEYRALATAGFAPERITPTVDLPADFDAFWTAGKDALAKLPVDAKLVPMPEAGNGKVDCWHVSLQNVGADTIGASRLFGMLCEPKGDGPFPALLQVPGAGVRAYGGNVEMAEKGVITLQIGIHGLPVNLDPSVYQVLGGGALQGYPTFNLDERDRYYYRRVYLGCVRANDFLVTRPRFDGRTLGVTGGSQGGALSIVTAGLDSRVKFLAAYYPALADVTGYLHGRAGGWPHMFRDEKRRLAARIASVGYYDVVNFARRVRMPGLYSWGFNDETCPPTSMYAAYGVIPGEKSLLLALETGHFTTPEQTKGVGAWLEARLRSLASN